MLIWLKGCYKLSTNFYFNTKLKAGSKFLVPLKDDHKVSVSFNYKDENESKRIVTVSQYDVSDELYDWITSGSDFKKRNDDEIHKELKNIISDFDKSAERVIDLIKYTANEFRIDENPLLRWTIAWSIDNLEYHRIKGTGQSWGFIQTGIHWSYEKEIQNYLDTDFEPFVALKYLHRAINEDLAIFKIIDTTIAAELAIKEFLVRKKPELEALLLELPSPPLSILYGRVLKSYYGDQKSYETDFNEIKTIIDYGSQIRNKLIHNPGSYDSKIDIHLAVFYCTIVQMAIYRLLHHLYPEDKLIKKLNTTYYSEDQIKTIKKSLEIIVNPKNQVNKNK